MNSDDDDCPPPLEDMSDHLDKVKLNKASRSHVEVEE